MLKTGDLFVAEDDDFITIGFRGRMSTGALSRVRLSCDLRVGGNRAEQSRKSCTHFEPT